MKTYEKAQRLVQFFIKCYEQGYDDGIFNGEHSIKGLFSTRMKEKHLNNFLNKKLISLILEFNGVPQNESKN